MTLDESAITVTQKLWLYTGMYLFFHSAVIYWTPIMARDCCSSENATIKKKSWEFLFIELTFEWGGEIMKKRSKYNTLGFLWWLSGEQSTWLRYKRCRRHGFNPWIGKILWRRNGNPLQYPCQGNPMDREAWQATVHGVTKESDTTELLNNSKTLLVISPTVEKIKQVSEKGNFSDGVGNFSGGWYTVLDC